MHLRELTVKKNKKKKTLPCRTNLSIHLPCLPVGGVIHQQLCFELLSMFQMTQEKNIPKAFNSIF